MIDASDAIVVARAIDAKRGKYDSNEISFEVEEILKGAPTKIVRDLSGGFGKPIHSDPEEITSANPEAFRGSCNRHTYRRGGKYVLMLRKDSEYGFVISGDPFSRINEDDFGPQSMWRLAIDAYLDIQKNPDRMAQIDAMAALVERGRKTDATAFEVKLGEDALIHLASIHPDKPTAYLMRLYDDPEFLIRRFEDRTAGTEEERADALAEFAFGEKSKPEDTRTVILRALSEGDHPGAEPLFRSIIVEEEPDSTQLGAALAFLVRRSEYDEFKRAYGDHVLWILGVTGPGPSPGFWFQVSDAVGYGDQIAADPEFAAWWKRQGIASCLIKSGPYSCSYDWKAAANLLDNPREHEVLLFAGAGSPKVIEWAERELDRLEQGGVESYKDDWDFPVKILLAAYRGDEPARMHQLACGSKEMRESIAGLIGEVPTLYSEQLMREMMAMEQHEHVRGALLKSAVLVTAHNIRQSRWRDTDVVVAYARANGPIPYKTDDKLYLHCAK